MSRKIEVQILGDSKSLEAALGRAQQKTSGFGRALAVGAKVGAAGLLGLGVAAKIGFDELTDSQKVMNQTQAVLKSTGGAAGVTAGHVNTLAQSLLQLSGVDDENIQAGENMLLTFRNIHNEAGRTNDVFDQATKATLDLSVAMGRDMTSSAILVGKALNDPVKGLTALRRVGVQFTADQEALIKKLVETGNTAEAQKIILGELNQEFGGSAEAAGKTLPAQLNILKESFADVSAQVVSALLPSLNSLIGVLTSVTGWMKRNQTATRVLVTAIAALSTALIAAKAAYALANSGLVTFLRSERVAAAASRALSVAIWLVNVALDANPVVLITAGIIAFGVALVIAYKKSKTFRAVVQAALSAVGGYVDYLKGVWSGLLSVIQSVINAIKTALDAARSAASAISGFVGGGAGVIHHPVGPHPSGAANLRVAPIQNNIYLDGKLIHSSVANQDKVYRRQNGRSAFAV